VLDDPQGMNPCPCCKGTLVRRNASYTATRKGYHLIMDDVPAWMCEQCGETLFDEETVDTIQETLRQVDARLGKLAATALSAAT